MRIPASVFASERRGAVKCLYVVVGVAGVALAAIGVITVIRAHLESNQKRAELNRRLRVPVCAVAKVPIRDLGVDAVDPRVLERALQVEGDQLPDVTRGRVDEYLREHVARACDGGAPALVRLYGPSKAGKSRSMLEALLAELPRAAIVAPGRTRENLQTVLDCGVLPRAAGQHDGSVVLWLDDLEGFVRVGNMGSTSTS